MAFADGQGTFALATRHLLPNMVRFDRVLTSQGLSSRVPMTASCTGVSATGPAVLVASCSLL